MHNNCSLLSLFCSFCRWGEMTGTVDFDFTLRHSHQARHTDFCFDISWAKVKLEDSPWTEVVSLSRSSWWPGAYFTKWLNGNTKSVNHEMRGNSGFSVSLRELQRVKPKKRRNRCGSESVAPTDLWPPPGGQQVLSNKSRIFVFPLRPSHPFWLSDVCALLGPPDQHFWVSLNYALLFHFKLSPNPHIACWVVSK